MLRVDETEQTLGYADILWNEWVKSNQIYTSSLYFHRGFSRDI